MASMKALAFAARPEGRSVIYACDRNGGSLRRLDATEWSAESLFETDLPRLINAEHAPEFEF